MNVASPAPQMKRDWLDWPFFGESHRAFAGALDRFVASGAIAAIDHADVDGSCRKLVRALGEAGLLDAAVAPPRRRRLRNQLAKRLSCARDARLPRRARRFRLRHAGPRLRRRRDRGFRRAAQARAAKGSQWRVARRLRALGEGGWLRRGGDGLLGARGRKRISPGRREDLDLERRDRRRLHGVRPHRRSAGRARNLRVPGFSRRSRFLDRRTHRRHGAASAGHTAFRRLPSSGGPAARRPRRGLQDRHAHARHLPRLRRRRGAWLRAARVR